MLFGKTKCYLLRFYYECMLPEILDSRHNRHMPIRNPKYIIEAKEEAAKKSNIRAKNIRKKALENENVIKEKKIKYDFSSMEATNTVVLNTKQNDDCVIISYTSKRQNITDKQMTNLKKYLDEDIPSFYDVKKKSYL